MVQLPMVTKYSRLTGELDRKKHALTTSGRGWHRVKARWKILWIILQAKMARGFETTPPPDHTPSPTVICGDHDNTFVAFAPEIGWIIGWIMA